MSRPGLAKRSEHMSPFAKRAWRILWRDALISLVITTAGLIAVAAERPAITFIDPPEKEATANSVESAPPLISNSQRTTKTCDED